MYVCPTDLQTLSFPCSFLGTLKHVTHSRLAYHLCIIHGYSPTVVAVSISYPCPPAKHRPYCAAVPFPALEILTASRII